MDEGTLLACEWNRKSWTNCSLIVRSNLGLLSKVSYSWDRILVRRPVDRVWGQPAVFWLKGQKRISMRWPTFRKAESSLQPTHGFVAWQLLRLALWTYNIEGAVQ
jgi:hypothetical protein